MTVIIRRGRGGGGAGGGRRRTRPDKGVSMSSRPCGIAQVQPLDDAGSDDDDAKVLTRDAVVQIAHLLAEAKTVLVGVAGAAGAGRHGRARRWALEGTYSRGTVRIPHERTNVQ